MSQPSKGIVRTRYCECGCGMPLQDSLYKGRPRRFIYNHHARVAPPLLGKTRELHPRWAGDAVGYVGIHTRIRKLRPLIGVCDDCGEYKQTELANISGEYLDDISDWKELCRKCHFAFDGGVIGERRARHP